MALIPDPLAPFLDDLLTDLCCRLENSDSPVCRCGFGFGSPPPMSQCCECEPDTAGNPVGEGEAWVSLGSVFPADLLLSALEAPDDRCSLGIVAAQITIGIYRCAPTIDDQGNPPSIDDLAGALALQLQDRALLFQVARCVLKASGFIHQLGTWDPVDPQGGCMGSQLAFTIGMADCLACPTCPPED